MAKMFYTLEETAAKLSKSEQEIKDMAAAGELQQFRDRDKLMFKVEQVDALLSGGSDETVLEDTGTGMGVPLADDSLGGSAIGLGDSAINLQDDTSLGGSLDETNTPPVDPNDATGVSVFDAGEIEPADSMAQTQVTGSFSSDDEELALDSVGSGSGLLDLTRESDDTSLGAELLDEIYPGGGESSDSKLDSAVGSSGVFDGSMAETGASGPSGLENLDVDASSAVSPAIASEPGTPIMPGAMMTAEEYIDPAWSGFGAGALFGATITLIVGLIVAISAVAGVTSSVTAMIASSSGMLIGVSLGLLVLSFILGAIGLVIGKAASG